MASTTSTSSASAATARQPGSVAARVAELRRSGAEDPEGAREEAWTWIEELGRRARSDRTGALDELQQLFVAGEPADDVRGQTEGRLVTWTLGPLPDRIIGAITGMWMPWLGKAFDSQEQRGVNTLTRSARWPSKLLWPAYRMRPSPLGHSAFDFRTYLEPGRPDPELKVLVIDYASVPENPRLLIRQIRDELVRIVPGANLGKMLVSLPGRTDPVLGCYFALKSAL